MASAPLSKTVPVTTVSYTIVDSSSLIVSPSPPNNPFSIDIKDLAPIVISDDTFQQWRHLFEPILYIYGIHDHIELSGSSSANTTSSSSISNVSSDWLRIDKLIPTWINATFHPDLLPLLYGVSSAFAA